MSEHNSIKLSQFDKKLFEIINNNVDKCKEMVEEELLKAAKFCVEDLKVTTPRSNRNHQHLADTFTYEKHTSITSNVLETYYKIYSEEKGYLVHLLEFGFKPYRANKLVKGRPFMLEAQNRASDFLVTNIKQKLKEIL